MLTDKRLIRYILKKGSDQAADKLIRRYYDDLYFYLYRQVGNRNDARFNPRSFYRCTKRIELL